jgi:Uma2 family endonuclease
MPPMPQMRRRYTVEDLLAEPALEAELSFGELRPVTPAGWRHGRIAQRLAQSLGRFAEERGLGLAFVEAGFVLRRDPDTVRAPDFAIVRRPSAIQPGPGDVFWPGAPDLAVEILSPSNRRGQIAEKVCEYLEAGTSVVWVIDPEARTVVVHRPGGTPPSEVRAPQALDLAGLVPSWSITLDDLFDGLDTGARR